VEALAAVTASPADHFVSRESAVADENGPLLR